MRESSKPPDHRFGNGDRPVIIICGPTASGKSEAAIKVAETFDGVVINADSMQIYQELKCLTARPDDAAEAAVPHRLYGTLSIAEACSVGHWLDLARAEANRAWDIGKLPIFCGGTGLYLKALAEGIATVPEIPDAVRQEAEDHLAIIGNDVFHQELKMMDPGTEDLRPTDRQRMVRAWCVKHHTGKSLSDWHKEKTVGLAGARFLNVTLLPDRGWLYPASDERFLHMLEDGALDEVEALKGKGFASTLPGMKAVGVREITAFLDGTLTRDEMIATGQQATRRYAKRQYTWFRNQTLGDPVISLKFDEQYSERLGQKIFSNIRQFLLTDFD